MRRKTKSGKFILLFILLFFLAFSIPEYKSAYLRFRNEIGLTGEDIYISGTGSMYPTFPKGKGETDIARANEIVSDLKMKRYPGGFFIGGKRWYGHVLMRGDIVSFYNATTEEISKKQYEKTSGFIKRVIGLAGDRIEIREGFVRVNGVRQKEAYTARPRSTFGGSFLSDCREIIVPEHNVFVMGDNRTGSTDSRYELGFIDEGDIDHVLPWTEQTAFASKWRDPSNDDDLISQPTLNAVTFVSLLNEKRKEAKLPLLQLKDKLIASAKKRGDDMLTTGDISFEATKSGYTIEKSFREVGYSNIVWGEAPTVGFYTAEELIENSFQFPDTKKFLLNREFQDIGVSAVLGNLNGCPTQIVVQHFGGYKPPNYSQHIIGNWKQALANLRDVKPSWDRVRTIQPFYDEHKADVDRLLQIMDQRIANIEKIIARMDRNEWLTLDEQAYIDSDKKLYEDEDALARKLNNQ